MPAQRALMCVAAAMAMSLLSLSAASATAWARCGNADCGAELALSIVVLPPATLLAAIALLLLRSHERSTGIRRAVVAACIALATVPLAAFIVRDPLVLGLMSLLLAALAFMAQRDDAPGAERLRADRVNRQVRRGSPADRAAVALPAYADPEQMLRLNAVRDIARTLDAGAFRLQQTSVRTMTAMMRLRRALAVPEQRQIDTPPAWMLRARAPELPATEPEAVAEDDAAPRILQFPR